MSQTVTCPHCARSGSAPDRLGGRPVKCSGCGRSFPVPAAPAAVPVRVEDAPPRVDERDGFRPPSQLEVLRSIRTACWIVAWFVIVLTGFQIILGILAAFAPRPQPETRYHIRF